MKRYGLIGYPVAHSLSPMLFREKYGDDPVYELIETPSFEEAWDRFMCGYDAVNVTMPFKTLAAAKADIKSPEVIRTGAANLLVKTKGGIVAHNTDYMAVKSLLEEIITDTGASCATVVGIGGAGRAAAAAAEDCGLEVSALHHDALAGGAASDIIIYTLPSAVEGIGKLRCRHMIEANYRDPVLKGMDIRSDDGSPAGYTGGEEWLRRQADTGFAIMTRQDI